jgi:carbon-monoxide dehydrogenase catalytic subunit
MEFIQKKTADSAVENFLSKAAESGISLMWDRYEGQLPECGFCESGLSCRDCLQGPCISHPFRDSNKLGVCGKDKDVLASQTLLRLVIKGTLASLDQLSDFTKGVESNKIKLKNKAKTDQLLKESRNLLQNGGVAITKGFPKSMVQRWEESGIIPEGISGDIFKASQKLEGGIAGFEETLLWAFKVSLLAGMAQKLQGSLKKSVFGNTPPAKMEVNLGILKKETPNLLLYGSLSPVLKQMIAEAAQKKRVHVAGVCTDPHVPPYHFSPVTNYVSQEIPLMSGAVDLIVAGDQFVNPSLADLAKYYETPIISVGSLNGERDLDKLAKDIVEQAKKSFDFRRKIPRDIPEVKESAVMGFSCEDLDLKKVVKDLDKGKIKGIAILSGSNNVKLTQDRDLATIAQEFLKNDILCISEGEASISLAKYGFLNPSKNDKELGKGLSDLLRSLGKALPSVLDLGSSENGGVTDFLLNLAKADKKEPGDYPLLACFAEAHRSTEVAEALWMVAMGISTYFWPSLPVSGSPKTMEALSHLCQEKFGSKLHVLTDKKMEPRIKASLMIKDLTGERGPRLSGHPWKRE